MKLPWWSGYFLLEAVITGAAAAFAANAVLRGSWLAAVLFTVAAFLRGWLAQTIYRAETA